MSNKSKYKLLDLLIKSNHSFAIYKEPDSDQIQLVLENQTSKNLILDSFSELEDIKGFVIAPFHIHKEYPLLVIQPDTKLIGEEDIFNFLSDFKFGRKIEIENPNLKQEEQDYKKAFSLFKSKLIDKSFEKIVLSRPSKYELSNRFSAGISFKNAIDMYNNNYVYLCHSSITGTWLGISPEMLLSGNAKQWKTVALAGTKTLSEKDSDWDEKNILEQKIVIDFVEEQLKKLGADYTKSRTKTIRAARVLHRRTDFNFQIDKDKLVHLIDLLHPTPAVCGFPKEACKEFILENEGYDRRYYSGFVGYFDSDAKTSLYVNLRCMEIHP